MEDSKARLIEYVKRHAPSAAGCNPGAKGSYMAGYKAGYKAAFEWVSVDDGLPDNGRAILAFNEVCRAVWVSNRVEDGGVIPLNPPFWGEFKATHWREIEMRAIVD